MVTRSRLRRPVGTLCDGHGGHLEIVSLSLFFSEVLSKGWVSVPWATFMKFCPVPFTEGLSAHALCFPCKAHR